MARSGVEPDIENVRLLGDLGAATLRTGHSRRQQLRSRARIPDIRGVPGELGHDRVEILSVCDRREALLAVKGDDRHTPDALAGDAPVRTRSDHVIDPLLAPGWHPFDFADGVECALPQI